MKPITPAMIAKIGDALREFGYTHLSDDEVALSVERARANQDANIIDAFVRDILTEAGLLEKEKTP